MKVSDNILIQPFDRGLQIVISLDSTDIDFTTFGTIVAQIKKEKNLDATPVFSYSLGSGIAVTATTLVLTVTEAQSKTLDLNAYWLDIKARVGTDPYSILLEAKLIQDETVTDQPT